MNFESSGFWTSRSFQLVVLLLLLEVIAQLLTLTGATTSSRDEDLSLTYGQKLTLNKFKERMNSKLPHDYMKTDMYLARWLRANYFNMDKTENMLNADFKWRQDNKMDTILEEDSSFSDEKFPYFLDTYAKNGEPIFTANFGDWNVREASISGRMQQLIRQFAKAFEQAATIIRKLRSEGKQVTQFHFIVNLDRCSIITHGCISCLPFYHAIIDISKYHYPGLLRNFIMFNTPPSFEELVQAIRPAMSPRIQKAMRIYGQDKRTWRKALLEIVDENQLTPDFGGAFVRQS